MRRAEEDKGWAAPSIVGRPQPCVLQVAAHEAGIRLDKYLVSHLPGLSRSQWQRLIQAGQIHIAHGPVSASRRVKSGEVITVRVPPARPARPMAEQIPLHILYEDEALLVVDKPPGMVVHPAPGHYTGTLVNALLYHCQTLSGIGGERRPGIVHRLDRDTSGILLVAKHDRSHRHLAEQLRTRQIHRRYIALVHGRMPTTQGIIDAPIGRHPRQRKKMAVVERSGRMARTHYTVLETWGSISLVRLELETGRTHQIRVHMAHVGHGLLGDLVYGATANWRVPDHPMLERSLRAFPRQALHAEQIRFLHPESGRWMVFTASLPDDMAALLAQLHQEYARDGVADLEA